MAHDVFVSYSEVDKRVADAATAALEACGIQCWIAPRDIAPGAEWGAAIIEAIDHCRVMVLIFSSSANTSSHVAREAQYAAGPHAAGRRVMIVPLRIEQAEPTGSLAFVMSGLQRHDALTTPLEPHVQRLATSINAFLQTTPGPSPTPPAMLLPVPPNPAAPSGNGVLADLPGTWVGTGINVISLPDFSAGPPETAAATFHLKLHGTTETLEFTPVARSATRSIAQSTIGAVLGQFYLQSNGLSYLQRVNDIMTNEMLHMEHGFWLDVPPTAESTATIARLGAIAHGSSLAAAGSAISITGPPLIGAANTLPLLYGQMLGPPLTLPFENPPLPRNFKLPFVQNPNLALVEAILPQTIIQTSMLIVSTSATAPTLFSPGGGITSIPLVVQTANPTQLDAIVWIETVRRPDGGTFLQLQYTQTVILNFLGIDWPHVSVATLVKQ
jgi:hypothetical protein